MQRIILGLITILGAGAIITSGATGAFFSDTETSTDNNFTAGALDLKVDNDSYYNGNRCTNVGTDESPIWQWQGNASFPVSGTDCSTSFPPSDLDSGLVFFDFRDLKPDDEGEDTISLHTQNDAFACMEVSLTSNDDVSSTEPELAVDTPNTDDAWDGELAQNIQFFWWADDGDNVYEEGENPITESGGVETLFNLATSTPWKVALVDSENNIWRPDSLGPMLADKTYYIGKAWCFGTLTPDPLPVGTGVNPSVDPGVDCDGTLLDNLTQTDSATLDVAFSAVQARHNDDFLCETVSRMATVTVTKTVINNNGGNNVVPDFQLFVDNGVSAPFPVTSGVPTNVVAGAYTVNETGVQGYQASFPDGADDCDVEGQLTVAVGESKICNLTNDDLPANITLIKNVINNTFDGDFDAGPTGFGLRIDGAPVPHNSSVAVTSNLPHTINETGRTGYTFVGPITGTSSYGKSCPAVLGGSITLDEGETIVCTITNDDN